MEPTINEHVASFGSGKGAIKVGISFGINVDDSIRVSISKKGGLVTEHEFVCVMDEGRSNQDGTIDKIYILKPVVPYVTAK